jgi:hypothetical protein
MLREQGIGGLMFVDGGLEQLSPYRNIPQRIVRLARGLYFRQKYSEDENKGIPVHPVLDRHGIGM